MNILVIGKGGREHALAYQCSTDDRVQRVFVFPGNPGMQKTNKVESLHQFNLDEFFIFIKNQEIALTIIGSEEYIINGVRDQLELLGKNVIAPTKNAAILETSKNYSKDFMFKYKIPTAKYFNTTDYEQAKKIINEFPTSAVLKLSGLHAGKGVVVSSSLEESNQVLDLWKDKINDGLVIEERLFGFEVSMFYLCRNNEATYLGEASDYKRIFDNDLGPNTGGMGCYSPNAYLSKEQRDLVLDSFVKPTLNGMMNEGTPFTGVLFLGLMITENGPKLLEYNVRFGDPETQTFLPRIKKGFLDTLIKFKSGESFEDLLEFSDEYSVHIVKASEGYPERPITNKLVELKNSLDPLYFFAGVNSHSGNLYTNGGRVCGITSLGKSLTEARSSAYDKLEQVCFEGEHYRNDIGRVGGNNA